MPYKSLVETATRIVLSRWTVAAICVLGTIFLVEADNNLPSVPFALSATATIAAAFFLVSRRPAFSIHAAWAIVGAITVISYFSFKLKGFSLHVFDIVFALGDASLIGFLWEHYPHLSIPVIGALALAAAGFAMLWRAERPYRSPLAVRAGALLLAAAATPVLMPQDARNYFFYVGGHHASSFFASVADLQDLVSGSPLAKRLAEAPASAERVEALRSAPACGESRPDIVVVHGESHFPPSFFPEWQVDDEAVGSFVSGDGELHRLGVETFGGGSWITTLSIMTGLSGADFGWMRPYLTRFLEERVERTVPEILSDCGYRTAAILPMPYAFVNEGAFLSSIGFDEVLDAEDIASPGPQVRDSFYFDATERLIREHRESDEGPIMVFVETMFPHSPYDERLDPEAEVAGESLHDDPATAEFLRRLALSRADMEDFQATLADEPGSSGTLFMEYGDHQPYLTAGNGEALGRDNGLADWAAPQFVTHYAVHGYGTDLQGLMPGDIEVLDAAFLGFSLLDAAGLARGGVVDEVLALREKCDGRFHLCRDRDLVDGHLRDRVAAGILTLDDLDATDLAAAPADRDRRRGDVRIDATPALARFEAHP